jgi:replicative DNA helicase
MSDRFDADFRKRLIMALCSDPDFFRKAVDFLRPEMIIERPIQFAYSVILRCYEREGQLPSAEVLQLAAMDDLHNPDIPFELKPADSELDEYADTVGMACAGLWLKRTDQTAYMSSRLKDFLQMCYMAAIPAEATPSQRLEMYSQIYSQMQSYDSTESVNALTLDEALAKMSETVDIRNRIGTGLASVDVPLNGGLAPGEIGLIVAPSGTGKSNAMLNFACENALRGNQSMYITLELSQSTVLARIIAMLTGIRASLVSKGTSPKAMESWTESEKRRFHDLVDKDGKNRHILESIKILEYTDRHITPDTIKQEVLKWKEARIKAGVAESKLGFVAVDWLNNIDPSTLSMVNKNQNQAYIMEKVTESLRQMGSATETRVWTAQQAARSALNKEVLTMQDGRDSSGTFNPVDIAMGLAIKKEVGDKGAVAVKMYDSKSRVKMDPDREMVWSIMKDRNSGATGSCIKFYQGPSLKFYESKKECQRAELINNGGVS